MSIGKNFVRVLAPVALLALGGCATGFPAQVSRFQAMPAPEGQTFFIEAANPANRGGLEFAQDASVVRQRLLAEGYREADSPRGASLIVSLDYGVDNGHDRVEAYSSPFRGSFGFGRPFYSRFGYFGRRRSPFFWGWYDPFFDDFGTDVRSYTVYRSFVDLDIRRASDGQSVFEGKAQAQSATNQLQVLVPNLVEALFTGFPGNSGETVRITVPTEGRARR